MTDDLQARLDRAITEARGRVLNARSDQFTPTLEQAAAIDQGRAGSRDVDRWISERNARAIDHYAALVALRARIAALREVGCQYGCARYADKRNYCSRCRLLAEAESELATLVNNSPRAAI